MNNSAQKALLTLGFVGALFAGLIAVDPVITPSRPEFAQNDQPVCQFKGFGKPYMIYYNPAVNELDIIVFGVQDPKTQKLSGFKTSKDLANLVPIRYTIRYVDGCVKIDTIYDGWRETYVGKFIEGGLQSLALMPKRKHPGNPFIEIMLKEQTPSKIVVEDATALSYLVKHLQTAINKEQISATRKPLMLIEFKKINQTINEEALKFLTTYWTLVDAKDQEVVNFFKNTQQAINVARQDTATAKTILDSNGEAFMRLIEDECLEFKANDIMVKTLKWLIIYITITQLKDGVTGFMKGHAYGQEIKGKLDQAWNKTSEAGHNAWNQTGEAMNQLVEYLQKMFNKDNQHA